MSTKDRSRALSVQCAEHLIYDRAQGHDPGHWANEFDEPVVMYWLDRHGRQQIGGFASVAQALAAAREHIGEDVRVEPAQADTGKEYLAVRLVDPALEDAWPVVVYGRHLWSAGETVEQAKRRFRQAGGSLRDGYIVYRFGPGSIFAGVTGMGEVEWYGADPEKFIVPGRLIKL